MEDEQLLKEVGTGKTAAFRELYNRYASRLLGFIRRMTGLRTQTDTEGLLQEIMLRIWTKASLYDPAKGKAKPWIYKVAGRLTLNWLESKMSQTQRREVLEPELLQNLPDAGQVNPEHRAVSSMEADRALASMSRLPDDLRIAVTLRHIEGLSIEEIAEMIECPPGTVKSRIFYGLKKLREILGKEDGHATAVAL